MNKEIYIKLIQIIETHRKNDLSIIEENSNLIYNLGFDSVDIIYLISDIENVFKIKVEDYEMSKDNFLEVSNLVKYIQSKMNK